MQVLELIKQLESETPSLFLRTSNKKNWPLLADNILCWLQIFNSRRGGAVEKKNQHCKLQCKGRVHRQFEKVHVWSKDKKQMFLRPNNIVNTSQMQQQNCCILQGDIELYMDLLLEKQQFAAING